MNHDNDHDFHQFRGAFDSAMTPDAAFKAKMEKLLQSEKPEEKPQTSTVLASPPKERSATVIPPRRSHPLMVAAAVLTVFAVVVASVWVLSGDVLEGEYGSSPGGIATLPADAPGMPGEDVHLTAEPFPTSGDQHQLFGVYDGMLITRVWEFPEGHPNSQDATVSLIAQNAESGEERWQIEDMELGSVTHADNKLIGIRMDWDTVNEFGQPDRHIVAIELQTGEISWETRIERHQDPAANMINPVVANGHVAMVETNGSVYALDLQTGDPAWNTEVDPGEGWNAQFAVGDGPLQEVTQWIVSVAVWNDQIVIANGDGTVYLLDSTTGDLLNSYSMARDQESRFSLIKLELHPLPDGVIMIRDVANSNENRSEVVALDPETGNESWARELEGQVSIDVAENGTIVVNSHVWKQNSWFLQLIGQSGHSTYQFHWIDAATGDDLLTTDRGKLEAPRVTLTDGTYACNRSEEFVCFDRNGTRHIIDLEPWGDSVIHDGVLYANASDGIFTVELP